MSDNNPPVDAGTVDDAPLSMDAGVDKLTNLLADPTPDPQPEGQDDASAEADPDEIEVDVSEDVEADEGQEPDGSQDIKGGRFAPDTAKVTLEDGTVITVADLKRNNLFQRDYTKKTTELSEERKAFEAERQSVAQQAQSLRAYAERVAEFGKKYLPQPPEPFTGDPEADPLGYMKFMQRKQAYDEAVSAFSQVSGVTSTLTEEQQQQANAERAQRISAEMASLKATDPFFANEAKVKSFADDLNANAKSWWGLDPQALGNIQSATELRILRDAALYRKALAKTQAVQKQVQDKPIIPKAPSRRTDPRAQQQSQRQALSERLRNSGSVDDAAALIKTLII